MTIITATEATSNLQSKLNSLFLFFNINQDKSIRSSVRYLRTQDLHFPSSYYTPSQKYILQCIYTYPGPSFWQYTPEKHTGAFSNQKNHKGILNLLQQIFFYILKTMSNLKKYGIIHLAAFKNHIHSCIKHYLDKISNLALNTGKHIMLASKGKRNNIDNEGHRKYSYEMNRSGNWF